MTRLRAVVREHFTMNETLRLARSMDDVSRERAIEALELANQKRRAAETLDASGAYADALRLVGESTAALNDAWTTLEKCGWKPSSRTEHALDALRELAEQIDHAPERDGAIPAVLRARVGSALRLIDVSSSELFVATRPAKRLVRVRIRRWLECAALIVGIVFMVRAFYEAVYGVRIRASSELNPIWSADRAIDGDKSTDWTTSDGTGWIELQFHSPRAFHHIHVRNGQFFPDRGVKDVKVELYDEDAVRWSSSSAFTHALSESVTFDPNGVRATRVRITALSYFGGGAAISEITWE